MLLVGRTQSIGHIPYKHQRKVLCTGTNSSMEHSLVSFDYPQQPTIAAFNAAGLASISQTAPSSA